MSGRQDPNSCASGQPQARFNFTKRRFFLSPGVVAALAILLALSLSACSAQDSEMTGMLSQSAGEDLGSSAMFGAFTFGGVWQGMDPVLQLESDIGRRLDIVHWFTNWDNPYFPDMVEAASRGGRMPMISWQPHRQSVHDIAAGRFDDYIRAWARGAATAPGPLYVRPFPEMNGNWTAWNGDPEALVVAWRRVARIFDDEGASNVRWVFSPNVSDEPRTAENKMELYYPGHDVVDVLALDGYNWGEARPYIGWRSFEQVFATGYDRITAVGEQPVWIAEFASSDVGGSKSEWVAEMFASTAFDRVEALIWFNEDKEADWRMNADDNVLHAFRAALGAGTTVADAGPR